MSRLLRNGEGLMVSTVFFVFHSRGPRFSGNLRISQILTMLISGLSSD
jgi:hypothetical protein